MSFTRKTKKFLAGGLVALALSVMTAAAVSAQLKGAIFTTNIRGTFVNGNIYTNKEDVYLNGGPQPNAPCTAAGLPDGDYYFQVTDPPGKKLLSQKQDGTPEPIENRKVKVAGGVFVGLGDFPPGTHYVPQFDPSLSPPVSLGQCNGITVRLAPFGNTPNPGGEYKVWITKVSDYKPGYGSFGFIPSKTKTDNFKVPSSADTDGDGIPDNIDTDDDNDGVPDSEDQCPTEPGPAENPLTGPGCPLP